ncbi:MAG: AAA family ATPase [Cyanobacteria bacterium SBLK]|nr:AAA family ATPase [Cyanobacteria bacterium SBLK]
MKVKQLKMKNFRGFDDITIDFEPNEPTIFVGINGSGKSSILDGLVFLLFVLVLNKNIIYLQENTKPISIVRLNRNKEREKSHVSNIKNEIQNGKENVEIEIEVNMYSESLKWGLMAKHHEDSKVTWDFSQKESITILKEKINNQVKENKKNNIPLAIYYPIHRTFSESYLDEGKSDYKSLFNQFSAYKHMLDNNKNNFISFFNDYKSLEELEYEGLKKDREYQDPYLKGIQDAVYTFLNGFSSFQVRRINTKNIPQMIIEKKGKMLSLDQLSEGEKCLLAMVGDLARRLAIANPGRDNPLEGEGIVLIDEIELHLHPQWQRSIIKNLTKTFPNCQFIVTTHSPQVISEVRQVHLLHETDDGKIICDPIRTYGKDSNMILETLMGTVRRSQDIQDDLDRLFELIGDEKIAEAKALKVKIEDKVGTRIPELARADWAITDLEIMQEEDETDSQTKST